jgi:hypothetical protein
MPEDPLEQQVGGGSEAHGRPRVPGPCLLDGVHRQDANEVDGAPVSG